MKTLTVVAAGLGYNLLERNGMLEMAGLKFHSAPSVFPAVTCVAQASLRTGLSPAEHGMVSNGWWSPRRRSGQGSPLPSTAWSPTAGGRRT